MQHGSKSIQSHGPIFMMKYHVATERMITEHKGKNKSTVVILSELSLAVKSWERKLKSTLYVHFNKKQNQNEQEKLFMCVCAWRNM